jgi:NAD(P)-dependent dehydrogenase (short-subunit alcohol dehydrogenase family)
MSRFLDDRVVVVTGGGRGIGRAEALECARHGALVVVNDLTGADGDSPAGEVVSEIRAVGGHAIANHDDVSDWEGAGRLIDCALQAFGRIDALVNNAGVLRDRMLVNMSIDEWDAVMRVHLRGTFAPTRRALDVWRAQAKASGPVDARIINTSSPSGLYGNVGQANYGAAKAAIAALTVIASDELQRYGVTVNAIAPSALTRMTENLDVYVARLDAERERTGFDAGDPANIAPLVAWLASTRSRDITGRVFNVRGGHISVAETWQMGPSVDQDARWDVGELSHLVPELVHRARPNSDGRGQPRVAHG